MPWTLVGSGVASDAGWTFFGSGVQARLVVSTQVPSLRSPELWGGGGGGAGEGEGLLCICNLPLREKSFSWVSR